MKIKTLINTILIVTMLLLLTLQSLADEVNEEKHPDISLIHDKTLSIDKIIGDKLVKYYEHIIGDIEIKGDSILIHEDVSNGLNILYEKTWTDIDFELPIYSEIQPVNYVLKKKVVFPDEYDLDDVYNFYETQNFPIACWEVLFEDGRTILYDIRGYEIGYGPTIPSEAFLLSGPDDGNDVWWSWRNNAEFWYKRWVDSYTSIFSPYPYSQISPKVSNPNTELFYELAHGSYSYFRACSSAKYYASASTGSNVEDDMENRPPMKFAFIGSCGGMDSIGDNSFSFEFRKGQMTDTVTVGFTHVSNHPGTFSHTKSWQDKMFAFMDQGYTMYDSFTLATQLKPQVEPIVRFVGDEDLKIRELENRNPFVPYYPSPSDNIDDRDIEVNLIWSGGDPDCWDVGDAEDDSVYYDIYFGNDPNPSYKDTIGPFPSTPSEIEYDPGELEHDTQYYWKIVARDNHDAETTGPIWNFKTTDYCEEQLDQYNTQFDTIGYTINNGNLKAQSFKPSKNVLSKISLFIKKRGIPTDNLEMIICDDSSGEPDINNEIISISLPPEYIDRDFSWIEFDFFDISVTAGETYYIVLQTSSGNTFTDCYEWGCFYGNVYPQGQYWAYFSNNPGWQTTSSHDFCFKTYGFQDNSENGLDQKQTDVNGEIIFSAGGLVGYGKVAQSFIPSLDKLSRIKLMIQKVGNPNQINVAIRSNLNGNNLTIISKSSEEIHDEAEQVEFDFPDIDVISGNTYYIVISSDDGDLYNHYKLAVGYNTDYINGIFYMFERNSWISITDTDLWFKTYGQGTQQTHTLTINAQGHGSTDPLPGTYTYNDGESVILTAIADENYIFHHWTGNLTGEDNPATIIMDSNKIITAVFVENIPDLDQQQTQYDLGFKIHHAPDGDWGGAQTFKPTKNILTRVEIYIRRLGTPEFDLIVQLREGTPTGNLLDEVIFTPSEIIINWNWLDVNFDDIAITPGNDYCIVVSSPPSSVTNNDGYEWGYSQEDVYDDGCYWFTRDGGKKWTDLPAMYDFCFKTYGTNNGQETYTLTINIEGQGTTNPPEGTHTYNQGDIVTITATPNDNSHIFHQWSGDLTGYQDTITITMDSDKEVTANFTLRGDVNCDGLVGAADITYVQEIMFGNLEEIPAADVNQDGNVNIEDIQTIEQIFLGYTPN